MRRVLITGGCGFVGRHFVNRMVNSGDNVTVVDNLCAGKPLEFWRCKPEKKFSFYRFDARAFFGVHKADEFDLVIHLAAIVGGRLNIENDPLAVATDLSIDAEMFNWVVRPKKMPKVIYFSSSAVYPIYLQSKDCHKALTERSVYLGGGHIDPPDMTYGWAKLSGEYLAKFAHEKYGLDVRIYRPFGGYGLDQDLTYPIPAIIKRIVNRENPIIVWGSGHQERDFIWIGDIVRAVEATMDRKELSGKPLNLGTGRPTSFFDLARMACTVFGHNAEIRNDPTKPEGVFSRVANVTEMNKYYVPTVTLREGVRSLFSQSEPVGRFEDIQSYAETNYARHLLTENTIDPESR